MPKQYPGVQTTFQDKLIEITKKTYTDGFARPKQSGATTYDSAPTEIEKNGVANLDSILGRSRFDRK